MTSGYTSFRWILLKDFTTKGLSFIGSVSKYICFFHVTIEYVADLVVTQGPSMLPTIKPYDIILTEQISARRGLLRRNDIVVTKSPVNPKIYICKRIFAMPGDKIRLEDGTYFTIPKGAVWLEGDNSSNSLDSRKYGPIPYGLIRGRVIFRIWPLTRLKNFSER